MSDVCRCGHSRSMHPFGMSENLTFDGHCILCQACRQFDGNQSSPAGEGAQETRREYNLNVLRTVALDLEDEAAGKIPGYPVAAAGQAAILRWAIEQLALPPEQAALVERLEKAIEVWRTDDRPIGQTMTALLREAAAALKGETGQT